MTRDELIETMALHIAARTAGIDDFEPDPQCATISATITNDEARQYAVAALSAIEKAGFVVVPVPEIHSHKINLPWNVSDNETRITDCEGLPVAFASKITSVKKIHSDKQIEYNTSEAAGPLRARAIVYLVNAALGGLK